MHSRQQVTIWPADYKPESFRLPGVVILRVAPDVSVFVNEEDAHAYFTALATQATELAANTFPLREVR